MDEKKLQVQMLGNFAVNYDNHPLKIDRSAASKTAQLLQLVCLWLEEGIAKEAVMEALYGRDDVENRNGSLNNTIFRLRKQLEMAGLPKGRYIVIQNGILSWEGLIPIEVDVHEFQKMIAKGQRETEKSQRMICLMKACEIYRGEFLPVMQGEDWVAIAGVSYQKLYVEAMKEVLEWLKEQKKFEEIYKYSTAAAKIYPFEDWQLWQLDSLIELNRCQEAMKIYHKTTKMFSDELGLSPSEEMLERFRIISEKLQPSDSDIEEIHSNLKETEEIMGAYYCTFSSFVDIYRITSRMMERNGISVFLMLCTLTSDRDEGYCDMEKNRKASECLKEVIGNSLRKGDFYTNYNENCFLIALSGIQYENYGMISKRIDRAFKMAFGGKMRIQYYAKSMAELHGSGEQEAEFLASSEAWKNEEEIQVEV